MPILFVTSTAPLRRKIKIDTHHGVSAVAAVVSG
jgi:hypothetical protein